MGGYVLVVDDDPDVRNLLMEALRLMGLEVRTTCDGQQALQIVRELPPQVILLDLLMPTLDGFSTLARLQKNGRSRGIPVILLSGLAEDAHHMARLPGVTAVIGKGDFSLEQLRSSLHRAGLAA